MELLGAGGMGLVCDDTILEIRDLQGQGCPTWTVCSSEVYKLNRGGCPVSPWSTRHDLDVSHNAVPGSGQPTEVLSVGEISRRLVLEHWLWQESEHNMVTQTREGRGHAGRLSRAQIRN